MRTRRTRHAAGFSLIETLIAAGVLLIIAIGVLPLFIRAMMSNENGNESTQASNLDKTRLEDLLGRPFTHPDLDITAGTQSRLPAAGTWDYWITGSAAQMGDERWVNTLNLGDVPLWRREAFVSQYSVDDPVTPLPAGSPSGEVHLKSIQVHVDSTRNDGTTDNGPLGRGRNVTFTVYKAF